MNHGQCGVNAICELDERRSVKCSCKPGFRKTGSSQRPQCTGKGEYKIFRLAFIMDAVELVSYRLVCYKHRVFQYE